MTDSELLDDAETKALNEFISAMQRHGGMVEALMEGVNINTTDKKLAAAAADLRRAGLIFSDRFAAFCEWHGIAW